MFRIAFALTAVCLLWLHSLFVDTTHWVAGHHHIFGYGWIAWLFVALWALMFVGFAWAAWRLMDEKLVACLMLLGIPLFAFVALPQILYERVEITDNLLMHRREPPHTKYNADIALDDIAAVTETRTESGSFSTYYSVGYQVKMKDGRSFELPSNTVLTAAHETINKALEERGIPRRTITIDRQPQ